MRPSGTEETMSRNTFDARAQLVVGELAYDIFRLDRIEGADRLPYSVKVLLENALRNEDGDLVTADHVRQLGAWDPAGAAQASTEIQFTPAPVKSCMSTRAGV